MSDVTPSAAALHSAALRNGCSVQNIQARAPKQTSFDLDGLEDDPNDFWDFNKVLADYWDDGYWTGDDDQDWLKNKI